MSRGKLDKDTARRAFVGQGSENSMVSTFPGVEKTNLRVHTSDMTNKQIVEDLLQRIPEGASLHDIAREIEFIAAVRQGLAELDRGDRIPIEEVERELPSWIIR
jgi:hypothetical protein